MNTLFLTSTLPRFPNDSQAPFVLEHALAWKKTKGGGEVHILAPHDKGSLKEETTEGVSIHRFRYFCPASLQKLAYPAILPNIRRSPLLVLQLPFLLLAELLATRGLVEKHNIDLIFAHWVMPQGLIAYLVHKMTGVSFVLQNHSSDLRVFGKIPFGRSLAGRIIRCAKKLFCVNSILAKEAQELLESTNNTESIHKVVVRPMGVRDFKKIEGNLPLKYDFGLIGRLTAKKGAHFLIAALKKLRDENVTFTAAIAGDGEETEYLKELAKGLNIDFLGFVTEESKARFFYQTRILAYPSIPAEGDVEGLPVALLEALSLGKVVIASEATNIKLLEEFDKIKEVVYVLEDPRDIDRLSELLKETLQLEDERIAQLSPRIQKIIDRYRWTNLIKEYISLIESQ